MGAGKLIETRHWPTSYTGPIAIHAAKRLDEDQIELCMWNPLFRETLAKLGFKTHDYLPLGKIVSIGTLDRCRIIPAIPEKFGYWTVAGQREEVWLPPSGNEFAFGNYEAGRFAWIMSEFKRLVEPFPMRGQQGLWDADIPDEVLRFRE